MTELREGTSMVTHGDRSTLCCLVLLRAGKHTRLPPHLHRAGMPTLRLPRIRWTDEHMRGFGRPPHSRTRSECRA